MKLTTKSQIELRRLELLLIANKKMRIYSSASIAANPLLCVRPSSWSVKLRSVSTDAECVPAALAQGRLFCKVGFRVSALCALQMCLTWCVGDWLYTRII